MPLYEYMCVDCGQQSEVLVTASSSPPRCRSCGGENLKKLLSAHTTLSGSHAQRLPGPGDTTCCGTSAAESGCAGPGSCCGKGV